MPARSGALFVPGDDSGWTPYMSATESHIGLRHLTANSVGADRRRSDAEVRSNVGGRPPLRVEVRRRAHGGHSLQSTRRVDPDPSYTRYVRQRRLTRTCSDSSETSRRSSLARRRSSAMHSSSSAGSMFDENFSTCRLRRPLITTSVAMPPSSHEPASPGSRSRASRSQGQRGSQGHAGWPSTRRREAPLTPCDPVTLWPGLSHVLATATRCQP